MQALARPSQPLAMEDPIDFNGARLCSAISSRPCGAESLGAGPPTEETRSMAGGQGSRLVQEKKLGPAPGAHHLASDTLELAHADDPGLGRPTPTKKRSRQR